MHLAVGKIRAVDLVSHGEHFARDILVWIFIAREIALHVAERALHPQSGAERPHRRHDLVRLQNLQILRRRLLTVSALGRRWLLRDQREQNEKQGGK